MSRWTERELEILDNNYVKLGAVALSARLGKSQDSVRTMAKRRKLASRETYTARQRAGIVYRVGA